MTIGRNAVVGAGEVSVYSVNFHDNDLIPIDATPADSEAIKKSFRKALDETGLTSNKPASAWG